MDGEKFDKLAKVLSNDTTRRGVLGGLAGILASVVGGSSAEARKRAQGGKRGKGGKPKCRQEGHPCEGNQKCCGKLDCRVTGPGKAKRCAQPICSPAKCNCSTCKCKKAEDCATGCCKNGYCCPKEKCAPPPPPCVTEKCNKNHPCCEPEKYTCSSTTHETGKCVPIKPPPSGFCGHSVGTNGGCKGACTSQGEGCGGSCEDICSKACPVGSEDRECTSTKYCKPETFTCVKKDKKCVCTANRR